LDDGTITLKEYDRLLLTMNEAKLSNFGYCFMTFSHADEAKFTAMAMESVQLDGMKLDIFPKVNVDHKDFDKNYTRNKIKNDSLMIK
jgi:hypothetical protein